MADTQKLQQKARALEQRGRWREALDTYQKVIGDTPAGEVDAALWNRVGDLHLRLSQTRPAVDAYGTAAASYEHAGLYDNARALCRKILRAVPGRAEAYRALARISAHQGFAADARENFLLYANHLAQFGSAADVRTALDELATAGADRPEIARLVSELRAEIPGALHGP